MTFCVLILAKGATLAKNDGNNLLDKFGYGLAGYGNRDDLVRKTGDEGNEYAGDLSGRCGHSERGGRHGLQCARCCAQLPLGAEPSLVLQVAN
jgi:hypothetical protein